MKAVPVGQKCECCLVRWAVRWLDESEAWLCGTCSTTVVNVIVREHKDAARRAGKVPLWELYGTRK